jgi:hypothetical protein
MVKFLGGLQFPTALYLAQIEIEEFDLFDDALKVRRPEKDVLPFRQILRAGEMDDREKVF